MKRKMVGDDNSADEIFQRLLTIVPETIKQLAKRLLCQKPSDASNEVVDDANLILRNPKGKYSMPDERRCLLPDEEWVQKTCTVKKRKMILVSKTKNDSYGCTCYW